MGWDEAGTGSQNFCVWALMTRLGGHFLPSPYSAFQKYWPKKKKKRHYEQLRIWLSLIRDKGIHVISAPF